MIHYYEHVRHGDALNIKANTKPYTAANRRKPAETPGGTKHIAPASNTPQSHNTKPVAQSTPAIDKLNAINNELDKMKP